MSRCALFACQRLKHRGNEPFKQKGAPRFGKRKESSPQLRLVSTGLDPPAQPTPLLVFILEFVVSLLLFYFGASVNDGAHPLAGRPSGNVRDSNRIGLAPARAKTRGLSHPCAPAGRLPSLNSRIRNSLSSLSALFYLALLLENRKISSNGSIRNM